MKQILPILAGFFLFFVVQQVHAATLTLDKIGVSDVAGRTFSTWTYYGPNPLLTGNASPSSTVTVTIQGAAATTTSATTGAWSYQPTTMTADGAYPITIASGTESIQFTLNIAAASTDAATTTSKGGVATSSVDLPDSLPQTGSADLFLYLGGGALMLLAGISSRALFKDR